MSNLGFTPRSVPDTQKPSWATKSNDAIPSSTATGSKIAVRKTRRQSRISLMLDDFIADQNENINIENKVSTAPDGTKQDEANQQHQHHKRRASKSNFYRLSFDFGNQNLISALPSYSVSSVTSESDSNKLNDESCKQEADQIDNNNNNNEENDVDDDNESLNSQLIDILHESPMPGTYKDDLPEMKCKHVRKSVSLAFKYPQQLEQQQEQHQYQEENAAQSVQTTITTEEQEALNLTEQEVSTLSNKRNSLDLSSVSEFDITEITYSELIDSNDAGVNAEALPNDNENENENTCSTVAPTSPTTYARKQKEFQQQIRGKKKEKGWRLFHKEKNKDSPSRPSSLVDEDTPSTEVSLESLQYDAVPQRAYLQQQTGELNLHELIAKKCTMIKNIYLQKAINPELAMRFEKRWNRFVKKYGENDPRSQPVLAYYGTLQNDATEIKSKGMQGSFGADAKGKDYGKGIYLNSGPEQAVLDALSVAKKGTTNEAGKIVVLATLLGNSEINSTSSRNTKKFDSKIVPDSPFWIIYQPSQVLPLYILHFENEGEEELTLPISPQAFDNNRRSNTVSAMKSDSNNCNTNRNSNSRKLSF